VLQIGQHTPKQVIKVHVSNPNTEKIVIDRNEYSMFKMFSMQLIYTTKHQKQTTKTRHPVIE